MCEKWGVTKLFCHWCNGTLCHHVIHLLTRKRKGTGSLQYHVLYSRARTHAYARSAQRQHLAYATVANSTIQILDPDIIVTSSLRLVYCKHNSILFNWATLSRAIWLWQRWEEVLLSSRMWNYINLNSSGMDCNPKHWCYYKNASLWFGVSLLSTTHNVYTIIAWAVCHSRHVLGRACTWDIYFLSVEATN